MEIIKADLTIVGAGLAGICAAVAAARHGLKVVLINDRPVLGGNASSELGVAINGSAANGCSPSVYARESGLIEEIKLKLLNASPAKTGILAPAVKDSVLFDLVYAEPAIDLYLNTLVYDAEVENGAIKKIKARQLNSERVLEFISPIFIDSSGDGIIGYKSGALYMLGREGKGQFGESLAPDQPDGYTMGDTILFRTKDVGKRVEYKRPAFAYDITQMELFKNIGRKVGLHRTIERYEGEYVGFWWLEYGGQLNTITDHEKIVLELRRLVYGIWDFIKNSGEFPDTENLILEGVSAIAGKRESRRFVGPHVLIQNDIDNKTHFPDGVCIGGWTMDAHAPKGIYDDGPATHWFFVPGIYNIPFSCLYSKNISNLMFSGRNISASHLAFSSTRVMATGACMGQATGTAAYLCEKYGVTPEVIASKHIEELLCVLQQDDQTIVGRKEKYVENLLTDLNISASSTRRYANETLAELKKLDSEVCLALPVCTQIIDSIELAFKNKSSNPKLLKFHIYGGNFPENYIPVKEIRYMEVEIPTGHDGWQTIPIKCNKPAGEKLYLIFSECEDVSIYVNTFETTGVVSLVPGNGVEVLKNTQYNRLWSRMTKHICFRSVLPDQDMYNVANIVNGFSRPYGLPNLWASTDNRIQSKQWIKLEYNTPKTIREIQLVFNTGLKEEHLVTSNFESIVKAFEIIVTDEEGKDTLMSETENYLRVCKYNVDVKNVIKILINLKETNGSPYYEVFSIRLF